MPRGVGRRERGVLLPVLAALAVLLPLGWLWQDSRVPSSYSAMDMGYADLGGGPVGHAGHGQQGHRPAHDSPGPTQLVTDLVVDPQRPADVRVELVARQEHQRVGNLDGFTLNGTSPGPEIRARQGQLVEVVLTNASVVDGVTLHWHGVDVPNAMDGVAGVTQDAVPVGGRFVYRFVVERAGSYWYHAHQMSHPQVVGGLFGSLVVTPQRRLPEQVDVTALAHTYGAVRTVNGRPGDLVVSAATGQRVRVRITNTDNAAMPVWVGGPYRVLAVDGTELHAPGVVADRALSVAAGGRVDLGVTVPADGRAVRVQLSKATAVVVGPPGATAPEAPQPSDRLDLLTYGSPSPTGIDAGRPDRRFDYVIGRRPGFVRGRPGIWWSINGRLYPHVPMFVVAEGDVVRMRIENSTSEVHPMHLHGHRMLVLSRDGRLSSGSPWWVDSLDVLPDETYEVAFVADNPGLWMDHCHNLEHAEDGMVAHLGYDGVDTPFRIGGEMRNRPE